MNDSFLSQEEIDSLLKKNNEVNNSNELNDSSKDILGEVGNISMSTAATTLSTILNRKVEITTPRVNVTPFKEFIDRFEAPYVLLQVQFEEGLNGTNAMMISLKDAAIIANVMMGGDGSNPNMDLSDIELSAVSESMNQMIGSASTAISQMLGKFIDIKPPLVQVLSEEKPTELQGMDSEASIVHINFDLKIEDLIDSEIMQIFAVEAADEIVNTMMGGLSPEEETKEVVQEEPVQAQPVVETAVPVSTPQAQPNQADQLIERRQEELDYRKHDDSNVFVQKPEFSDLKKTRTTSSGQNIDLILDVALELSVVLGKTKASIKNILDLEPGSIVELDKFAEEPLEIYANGKLIAYGEVVVIEEKFGVRVNSIISPKDRVNSLK